MTKLLLTSTGLTNQNIKDKFLQLIDKELPQTKIAFVTAAARTDEELYYINESYKELIELGILDSNIKPLNLDQTISWENIKDHDVIYICGGNTFYLLYKIKETGFDKIIQNFVESDKLYFGVSAGSIVVGPDIAIAAPFDENDINLNDFTGLGLTDIIVSPHYVEKEKNIIDNFEQDSEYKVIRLTDHQGLLIKNSNKEIIY